MLKLKLVFYTFLFIVSLSVLFLNFGLDRIAKITIESSLSEFLGQPVTVGDINISVLNGSVSINKIEIANPSGFKNKNILKIGNIFTQIDIKSIITQPFIIKSVYLNNVNVVIELNKKNSININVLKNKVNTKNSFKNSKLMSNKDSGFFLFKIKKMQITKVRLTIDTSIINNKVYKESIDTIVFKNVGGKNGMKSDQIVNTMVNHIIKSVEKYITDMQTNKIKGNITAILKSSLGLKLPNNIREQIKKKLNERINKLFDK